MTTESLRLQRTDDHTDFTDVLCAEFNITTSLMVVTVGARSISDHECWYWVGLTRPIC